MFSWLSGAEQTKFCMQGCQSAHRDHSSIRREDLPDPEPFRLYYKPLHREVVVYSTNRNEGHVQVANITLKSCVKLGHSSVVITLDVYSRCLPGVQETAAARFRTQCSHKPKLHILNMLIIRGRVGLVERLGIFNVLILYCLNKTIPPFDILGPFIIFYGQ